MRSTKVRPMVEFEWPQSRGTGSMGDEPDGFRKYMNGSRRDYHVRQAFLRSYKFTVEESFGEKVKRSLTELNEMARKVFLELRTEISAQRPGLRRVFRFRLPKSSLVPTQCFTVGQKKKIEDFA